MKVLILVLSVVASAQATVLVFTGTTAAASSGVAGLLVAKGVLLTGLTAGAAIGAKLARVASSSRSRRDAGEQENPLLLRASLLDEDDCGKKLVCLAQDKSSAAIMKEDEIRFMSLLSEIDVTSPLVEFQLASTIGRDVGSKQCRRIYARCDKDFKNLLVEFRGY